MVVLLFACAPKVAPWEKPEFKGVLTREAATAGKNLWQLEWEKTLEAARSERKVSAYSTIGAEVRAAISQSFKDRYGIEIEWVVGKTGELVEKLFRERRVGIYWADIATGGVGTMLNVLKPAGVLDPIEFELILPEVTNPKVWFRGALPFVDKDKTIFAFRADVNNTLLLNKSLATREEIQSYRDLLNPKWKGKIAWYNPTIGGSGQEFFGLIGGIIMGYDYMKQLVKQEPVIVADKRQIAEWIAKGKYAIGLGVEDASINELEMAGVTWFEHFTPREGSYIGSGSGNVHIYNRPSHPNARKVFLNWLLSKEGQTIWSQVGGVQSAREDVPTDHLRPGKVREPDKEYFNAINEEWQLAKDERLKLAQEIFGPLMK